MAKGALYWRLKDEQTGKWTFQKVTTIDGVIEYCIDKGLPQEEQ
jgi:hypothetical protein